MAERSSEAEGWFPTGLGLGLGTALPICIGTPTIEGMACYETGKHVWGPPRHELRLLTHAQDMAICMARRLGLLCQLAWRVEGWKLHLVT